MSDTITSSLPLNSVHPSPPRLQSNMPRRRTRRRQRTTQSFFRPRLRQRRRQNNEDHQRNILVVQQERQPQMHTVVPSPPPPPPPCSEFTWANLQECQQSTFPRDRRTFLQSILNMSFNTKTNTTSDSH